MVARVGAVLAAMKTEVAAELAVLVPAKTTVAVVAAVRVALQVTERAAWAGSLGRLLPTPCL